MDNTNGGLSSRSITFRALKYTLIGVSSLIILLIILGFIGFFGFTDEKEKPDGNATAFFVIDGIIGVIAAIIGLIAAIKERYVLTIACAVILILLAIVNFVLGVHWLDSALYLIGGIIAVCFAVWIKREVVGGSNSLP